MTCKSVAYILSNKTYILEKGCKKTCSYIQVVKKQAKVIPCYGSDITNKAAGSYRQCLKGLLDKCVVQKVNKTNFLFKSYVIVY